MEKDSKSNGLEKKDAMNQARWRMGVREIAAGVNPATPVHRNNPDQNWFDNFDGYPCIPALCCLQQWALVVLCFLQMLSLARYIYHC